MHGNVWEWYSGWYEDYGSMSATNPEGPAHGTVRVYRGGVGTPPPGFAGQPILSGVSLTSVSTALVFASPGQSKFFFFLTMP